jgi:hypothetical protein
LYRLLKAHQAKLTVFHQKQSSQQLMLRQLILEPHHGLFHALRLDHDL